MKAVMARSGRRTPKRPCNGITGPEAGQIENTSTDWRDQTRARPGWTKKLCRLSTKSGQCPFFVLSAKSQGQSSEGIPSIGGRVSCAVRGSGRGDYRAPSRVNFPPSYLPSAKTTQAHRANAANRITPLWCAGLLAPATKTQKTLPFDDESSPFTPDYVPISADLIIVWTDRPSFAEFHRVSLHKGDRGNRLTPACTLVTMSRLPSLPVKSAESSSAGMSATDDGIPAFFTLPTVG